MPDDVPRVDELFSRAVVAQLAEQRAQRETFAELERKLEGVERLVGDRLSELSKLLRSGEVELRLEILEEGLGERIGSLEKLVKTVVENRLDAVSERLARIEETFDDGGGGGGAFQGLEAMVRDRLERLEEAVRVEDTGRRLGALELAMTERLGHLEETVRVEEIGHRLKALELAIDERTSRIDEFVRTAELQERMDALSQTLEDRLQTMASASAAAGDAGAQVIHELEQNFGYRLTRLEGTLRRLEKQTATRLDDLRQANTAAETAILERITAESQVVDAHFQAVRPAVEAAAQVKPELEEAMAEVRELMERAAAVAAGDTTGPFPAVLDMAEDEGEEIFLGPEETPIPDRRWSRREKP
jgi:hypothetical protein